MKNIYSLCKAVFALSFGICLLPLTETYASTKTNVFASLVATTTYNQTSVKEATYYFIVFLPAGTKPLSLTFPHKSEKSGSVDHKLFPRGRSPSWSVCK